MSYNPNIRVANMGNALTPQGNYASVTPTSTASTLAELGYTLPETAMHLGIQVEAGGVRVTADGVTDPVLGTTGILWGNGTGVMISRAEALLLKVVIEVSAPVLHLQAY